MQFTMPAILVLFVCTMANFGSNAFNLYYCNFGFTNFISFLVRINIYLIGKKGVYRLAYLAPAAVHGARRGFGALGTPQQTAAFGPLRVDRLHDPAQGNLRGGPGKEIPATAAAGGLQETVLNEPVQCLGEIVAGHLEFPGQRSCGNRPGPLPFGDAEYRAQRVPGRLGDHLDLSSGILY